MSKRRSMKSVSLPGSRIEEARRQSASGRSRAQFVAPPGADFQSLEPRLLLSASVGDRVWVDMNGNGIQDAGEPGLSGVTVNLLDSGGGQVDTTTTNGSGNYGFTVAAGSYMIEFVPPEGYGLSPQGAGSNAALDSDADPGTGRTAVFTLVDDQTNNNEDAGMSQAATIGDFVWDDLNVNGIQDAGEPGLADVTVNLLDSGGNVVNTTTTDGDGLYVFQTDPGTYSVEFVPADGYAFSPQGAGSNATLNSKADPTTGQTAQITVLSGQGNLDQDAGMTGVATIGDFVWNDLNDNGIQDAGEPGLADVTVNLLDGGGNVVNTTTTDADGFYSLQTDPGTYVVEFVPLEGYGFSPQGAGTDPALNSKADPVTGRTDPITLLSGQENLDQDAGMTLGCTVGDFVWFDMNTNGIQNAGEPGLSDVTVNLLDGDGNVVNTTTTDSNGFYSFQTAPGTYSVQFELPSGYLFTEQGAGSNPALNSKVDPATGQTDDFTLVFGQQDLNEDAGLGVSATVGDFVWNDVNRNGIQDAGEPGLSGIMVNLLNDDGDVLNTTTTDNDGNYSFETLPGEYRVGFVLPAGMQFSPRGAGTNPEVDSDANPATGQTSELTLAAGEDNLDVDAGMSQAPVVCGAGGATRVTYTDTDGTNVTVTLTGGGTANLYFDGDGLTSTTVRGTTHVTDSDGRVELNDIDLVGTKSASRLSVTTDYKGNRSAQIGAIRGSTPLGTLAATTTDLTGVGIDMTGAGYIGNLSVRNLLNGADIEMAGTGPGTPWSGETIRAGTLGAGSDIEVGQALTSLTVVDWTGGELSAPRANSVRVTGVYHGAVGNMGADVSLTGSDTTGYSLGTLSVAGNLTSTMNLAGRARTVSAGRWSAGSLTARTLDSLRISGNRTAALAGDLGANITLTGASSTGYSCQSISVSGAMQSALLTMAGSAGSLTAKQMISSQLLVGYSPNDPADPMAGGTYDSTQSIRSVTVSGVTGSTAMAYTGSTIAAWKVGTVSLASFDSNNLGTEFGVRGQVLSAVTSRNPNWKWNKAGAADQGVGDFHVVVEV
jgi:hypothetical protein